jgi:hypothetical protein
MDIHKYLESLQTFMGNDITVDLGAAEHLPTDKMYEPTNTFWPDYRYGQRSNQRILDLNQIRSYINERCVKVRSYGLNVYWETRQVVVYSHDPRRTPKAKHNAGTNMRTLWHGCHVAEFLSILADEGCFRHTVNHSALLGFDGVYVGTFKKALNYMGDINHGVRPKDYNKNLVYWNEASILAGVLLKVRADIGRIKVAAAGDRYENLKKDRDTLCAYRGSSVGGTTWNASGLRESEWILNKEQVVIDEIHLVCSRRSLKVKNMLNARNSGRTVDQT